MGPHEVEALYRTHGTELVRFATVLVGPADAADVVAEAMVKVLTRPPAGGVTAPSAYLHKLVLRAAQDRQRSDRRRRRREQQVFGRRDRPAEAVEATDPSVVDALALLSPRQRAAVFLTYWVDLDPTAVADVLGTSPGTVHQHLARARANLREALDA
ncbi:N/A [soil metagenome]